VRAVPSGLARTLAFAAVVVAQGCGSDDGACDIESKSRKLGGTGLTDCGIASPGETSTVDRCAVTAFSTFRALYELDNGDLEALVHAAGDTYHTLRQPPDETVVERVDCGGAEVVTEGTRRYVVCTDPGTPREICR
jgi:hypothetical protein